MEQLIKQWQTLLLQAGQAWPSSQQFYSGCERTLLWQQDKIKLWYYPANTNSQPWRTPLLIVYAMVNRPDILDVQADRSLIAHLHQAQVPIYLLDWGYADAEDQARSLDDYITGYLAQVVTFVKQHFGSRQINLCGICQGGVFSLCFAALYPKQIKNLMTLVTPVDFHAKPHLVHELLKGVDINLLPQAFTNFPGRLLALFFISLKPYELTLGKLQDFLQLSDPIDISRFLHVEKWLFDNPDQPKTAFYQFVRDCYHKNLLIQNKLKLGRRLVNLKKITMPLFNIYAQADHIVPVAASTALRQYIASQDYSEYCFAGGHIGIFVSSKAQKIIPNKIIDWLAARDQDNSNV